MQAPIILLLLVSLATILKIFEDLAAFDTQE